MGEGGVLTFNVSGERGGLRRCYYSFNCGCERVGELEREREAGGAVCELLFEKEEGSPCSLSVGQIT